MAKKWISTVIFSSLLILAIGIIQCGSGKSFDLAILNGRIIAGDGNPWYAADIGIRGDRIVKIGRIKRGEAKQIIDARGLFVAPGFIDIHTHADRSILKIPTADNYIFQGVTTVLGGNCGGHRYPLKDLFAKIKRNGVSLNFCSLAGHNTIRREVMGLKMAAPTVEEMKRMKELLHQEMAAGAVGFSTGLAYMPGTYAKTEELVELVGVVAKYGGIYASHIRNQGTGITGAIEEAISIGRKNGVRVQISHVKLSSDKVWGEISRITSPVEKARSMGMEVTMDQYPYTATSSGFGSSFPSWALEGGQEEFVKRLGDPERLGQIKQTLIKRRLSSSKGIDKLKTINIASCKALPQYEGKNLAEILMTLGKEAIPENGAELIIEIQKAGGASGVFFQMDEKDVEKIMALDYNMVASDSSIVTFGKGVPHCRNYGTFPRIISMYVKKKKVLSLPEAIKKMTSLPAQTLRLLNRGLVRPGFYADLVIFDLEKIKDTATYEKPHQYPEGIPYVLVNGTPVVKNGKKTGEKPGMVLRPTITKRRNS
jgi:N-acyl-D-amino-acid deacylase